MSDDDERLKAIAQAADELIPRLSERLTRHRLGEIEVRQGELRVRVTAPPISPEPPGPGRPVLPLAAAAPAAHGRTESASATPPPAGSGDGPAGQPVTSPAVGFFVYAEGLGPGMAVDKGDALGHVEMLGVHHEVRAPRRGTVRHLVAEAGEPVEYGQTLVELESAE